MFDHICRTCLDTCGELVPIFSNDYYVRNLPRKLQHTINIEISLDDELPKMMCKKCVFLVDSLYCFKYQCEKAEVKLRKKIQKVSSCEDFYEYDSHTSQKVGNLSDTVISSEDEYHIEYASEEAKLEVENARRQKLKARKKLSGIKVKSVEILADSDGITKDNFGNLHSPTFERKEELHDNSDSDDRSSLYVSDGSKMYISDSVFKRKSALPRSIDKAPMRNELLKHSATLRTKSKRKLNDKRIETSKQIKLNDSEHLIENKNQATRKSTNFKFQDNDESGDAAEQKIKEKKVKVLIKNSVINVPPICALCSESFETYLDVLKHKIKTHLSKGQNQFFCPICYDKFNCNSVLIDHLNEHKNVHSYICLICSGNYYTDETLRNHFQSHVDLADIKCLVCSCRFTGITVLTKHLEQHINSKKLCCTLCVNSYHNKELLQKHVDEEHRRPLGILQENQNESDDQVEKEPDSKKKSVSKKNLRDQMQVDMKHQFACILCNKKFSSNLKRTQHMEEHMKPSQKTDLKKFRCRVCHEILVSRIAYGEHLKKEHWNSKETSDILKEISESFMNEQANISNSSIHLNES